MAALDVIVSWPRFADFPLWRQFIADERHRFGRVFVVFTEHDGPDLSGWVRANFPEATFLDSPDRGEQDWRTVAVNAALDVSTAERVWFTEQDFIVTDPATFWPGTDVGVVGIPEPGSRTLHPACIFAPRELVEMTRRDFSPDYIDHFARFVDELALLAPIHVIPGGWRHMQAISEGQYLISVGQRPKFQPHLFREWLAACLATRVPLHPAWAERARQEIAA